MTIDIETTSRIMYAMSKKTQKPSDLEKIIIKAIKDSGMNQPELEAKTGIDQTSISRFMTDKLDQRRSMTLTKADRLCKVLGLKLVKKRKRLTPFRERLQLTR